MNNLQQIDANFPQIGLLVVETSSYDGSTGFVATHKVLVKFLAHLGNIYFYS